MSVLPEGPETSKIHASSEVIWGIPVKDYPISTDGFHDISNRAVAAALYSEHMPDVPEASPEKRPQFAAPASSE